MAALDGIKVLDLSQVMQGPLAAQILGDFGAEVIKVERPGSGELSRGLDRYAASKGLMSCQFAALNRNKRALCLDLKKPEGRDALCRMVRQVDVLVHNFRPGAMERLGLSYEDLAEINPRLIYAVAYAFGESGPLSHKGGQDLLAQSFSGMAMGGVGPDEAAKLVETPVVDFAAGSTLAQGILLALLERARSGLGQKVTISLADTAIAMQMLQVSTQLMYDQRPNFLDYVHTFETADGRITVVGFFRDNPLRLICEAFEMEDLSLRTEFATADLQVENRHEIHALLVDVFRRHPTAECMARLEARDILCSPILTVREAVRHPQIEANQMLISVPIPGQEPATLVANPVRLSRTPAALTRGPPELAQDTLAVLDEFRFTEDEIEALEKAGVFGEVA